MTQNKYWLVWASQCPEVPQQEFSSQEEAINGAKILSKNCVGKDVCVAEVTYIIKGFVATQIMKLDTKEIGFSINIDGESDNVNGLPYPTDDETVLSEPVTDETPKPKFKIGDIVKITSGGSKYNHTDGFYNCWNYERMDKYINDGKEYTIELISRDGIRLKEIDTFDFPPQSLAHAYPPQV